MQNFETAGTKPAESNATATSAANETNTVEHTADEANAAISEDTTNAAVTEPIGVRARDDVRFRKFFKMVDFGVPAAAVKLKMNAEGVEDPSILEYVWKYNQNKIAFKLIIAFACSTPNLLLADGIKYEEDQ